MKVFLEKVKHTQVGVVHKIVEVDIIVNDKHTQDGVVHDVEDPSQFRVDDYFIYNDGEQEVLSVNEQSTHLTAIKDNVMVNKEEILFKIACNRIFKSLKNRSIVKCDFKFGFKGDEVGSDSYFFKNVKCNVVENLEIFNVVDGKAGTFCDFVDNIDVMVLDDGRLRPRDYYCNDVGDIGFKVVLLDDGRMRPRKYCDVSDFSYVGDGQNRVFNDGG